MNVAGLAILSAALLSQSAATSQGAAPWCGSKDRDIGRGFRVTQYMFGGAPEFTLKYRPPAKAVLTMGVEMTAPFQFMFSQMNFEPLPGGRSGLAGPHVGFTNYEFRKEDGTRLGTGILKLECGNGVELNAAYSSAPPPEHVKVPITSRSPFLRGPEQSCMRALQQNGHFKFTVAEGASRPPSVAIEGRIPVK